MSSVLLEGSHCGRGGGGTFSEGRGPRSLACLSPDQGSALPFLCRLIFGLFFAYQKI